MQRIVQVILSLKWTQLKGLFFLLGCCWCTSMKCQITDLARIEYTYIPQKNSSNEVNRFRALINYPIRMGWEGSFLVAGLEYRNISFQIGDQVPFDTQNLEHFQMFRGTMAYTFKWNEEWRLAARVGLEVLSNFEESKVLQSDINFTGAVYMIKDRSGSDVQKKSRFIIGLNYSTSAGRPFPLPVINYYRQFHPNWSYSVGSPKTNLKFSPTHKHSFQSYVTLDGFFANIQNGLPVPQATNQASTASNISMTLVLGGLGYEYAFTEHLVFYLYAGHTLFNEIRLRDNNRNNLFNINNDNTFYGRTGLKFKL